MLGELSRLPEEGGFGRENRFVETDGRRPHQSERLCDAVARIVPRLAVSGEQAEDQARVECQAGGRGGDDSTVVHYRLVRASKEWGAGKA